MQGAALDFQRITLERVEPLVPCTLATGHRSHLRNEFTSCGALIPWAPSSPCPNCGGRQYKPLAQEPPEGALIIDGNKAIVDKETGEVVAVHAVQHQSLANRLAAELRKIGFWYDSGNNKKPKSEARLSGIVSQFRTFGFTPPVPLRRRYACSRCTFDNVEQRSRDVLEDFCHAAEWVFRTLAPEVHAHTGQQVRDTIPEAWLMAGTPWTSGIINHTAALPYHRDSGNVQGSWSAMLAARNGVGGGLLHLADYDCYLAVPNGSISIFDGQSVLHGVTPLKAGGHNAYRYTVVTYARRGMKVCSPNPRDEAKRAALKATEAEEKRRAR